MLLLLLLLFLYPQYLASRGILEKKIIREYFLLSTDCLQGLNTLGWTLETTRRLKHTFQLNPEVFLKTCDRSGFNYDQLENKLAKIVAVTVAVVVM